MSNFSFSHSVFYPSAELFCYLRQLSDCHLQSLSVWKILRFVIWERVNEAIKSILSDNCLNHYLEWSCDMQKVDIKWKVLANVQLWQLHMLALVNSIFGEKTRFIAIDLASSLKLGICLLNPKSNPYYQGRQFRMHFLALLAESQQSLCHGMVSVVHLSVVR